MTKLVNETALENLTDDTLSNVVLADIISEMEFQDAKWGDQKHSIMFWLPILIEEVGEVAEAIVEYKSIYAKGGGTEDIVAKRQAFTNLQTEVIQVAATAAQFARDLHRKRDTIENVWNEFQEGDQQ